MGAKNIKTHFDYKVIVTFFLTLIIGGIILSFRVNEEFDCDTLNFDVVGTNYTAESLIEFKTDADINQELYWNFGDNEKVSKVQKKSVVHSFQEPGKYKVSLSLNKFCTYEKEITILPKVEVLNPLKIPNIIFPDKIVVGEEVKFTSTSDFAAKWNWKFGESDEVDATSQTTEYTFSSPGKKRVSLVVNDDFKHVKVIQVEVFPKEEEDDDEQGRNKRKRYDHVDMVLQSQIKEKPKEEHIVIPEAPAETVKVEKINVSSQQISDLIAGYAEGKNNLSDFSQYVCNNKIVVFDHSGKGHKFLSFLKEIKNQKIKIESIRLHKDKDKGCVLGVKAEMKIKSGILWKKY